MHQYERTNFQKILLTSSNGGRNMENEAGRCVTTRRPLNQNEVSARMGLVHFPTPIPFSGRLPKKYSGRRVVSIKRRARKVTQAELISSSDLLREHTAIMERWYEGLERLRRRYQQGAGVEFGAYGFDGELVIRPKSQSSLAN